jgi:hypothetical protein
MFALSKLPSWMTEGYWFIIGMAVLLLGLVAVFLFIRSRQQSDD